MSIVPILVLAAIFAFLLGLLIGSRRGTVAQTRLEERERELSELRTSTAASAARQIASAEQTDAAIREAFTALSAQALEANNQSFLDLARASLGEFQQAARTDLEVRQQSIDRMVKPIHEGLVRVDEKLQAFDKERAVNAATLQEHLSTMATAQQQLTGETQQLVRALRAPQVRGQWGEMQLKRVVELAGMQEHCDFVEQHSVTSVDGRIRPDLIVRLPGEKLVIVDAKAPLAAYLDAMETHDEARRGALLDQHARQVKDHVTMLASKDYSHQFTETPDFVVLFLPGEAFFSAACQRDPTLIDYAISKNVIPASPTTLVTVLKAVYYGWRQERIAKNTEQIRDAAIDLYGRMRTVGEHMVKVKKGLENAVSGYNAAVNSLETRVLPSARRLRDLGAGSAEEIAILEPVDGQPRLPAAPELVGPTGEESQRPSE